MPAYAFNIPEGPTGGWGGPNNQRGPAGDPANSTAARSAPNTFTCPSVPSIANAPNGEFKDYGVNVGTGLMGCCPERLGGGTPGDGMAAVNYSANMRDVTDGTSNTILHLEVARTAEHSWVAKNKGSNQFFWVHHPSQGMATAGELNNGPPFPPNSNFPNSRGAVGHHPGGINTAFADGHVKWITQNINFQVYRSLFSRDRGEVVSADSYLTPGPHWRRVTVIESSFPGRPWGSSPGAAHSPCPDMDTEIDFPGIGAGEPTGIITAVAARRIMRQW